MPLSNPVPRLLPSWGIIIRSNRIVASNGKKIIEERHRPTLAPADALKSFLNTHKASFPISSVLNICMPEGQVSFDFVDLSEKNSGNLRSYVKANTPNLSDVIWDTVNLHSPRSGSSTRRVLVNKIKQHDADTILAAGTECDSIVTLSDLMHHYFSQSDLVPPTQEPYIFLDFDGDMATFSAFLGRNLLFFRHQRSTQKTISADLNETLEFFKKDSHLDAITFNAIYISSESVNAENIASEISAELGSSVDGHHFTKHSEILAKLCARTPHLLPRKLAFIPLLKRPKKRNLEIVIVASILFALLFALTFATKSFIKNAAQQAMEDATTLQVNNTALISRYQVVRREWSHNKELKRRVTYLNPKLAPPLLATFYYELSQIPNRNIRLKELKMRQSKVTMRLEIPSATLTNSFLDYIESLKSISAVKRVSYSVLGKAQNAKTTVQVICELKNRGEKTSGK